MVTIALACSSPSEQQHKPPLATPAATALDVHVDRRIELFAILQRLVAAPEYMATPVTAYVAAVDAHFANFKDHPAVIATRELRQNPGIGFDGPMWLAIELDDQLKLKNRPSDSRWANVDLEAYLVKVRDFAITAGIDSFLAKHKVYLDKVEDRLRTEITKENPGAWFDNFFGAKPGAKFVVVPALLVGQHNFGPHTATELFQIIGVVRVDFDELPTFDPLTLELIVHEMAHSYVNPLFEKHRAELEPHGRRLLEQVGDAMRKQAYPTWEIVMNEQGVRAVTVLYLRERKGAAAGDAAAERELARSFLWTKPIVAALAEYRAARQQFADLDAFWPKLLAVIASAP